jgi:hypothetical protein
MANISCINGHTNLELVIRRLYLIDFYYGQNKDGKYTDQGDYTYFGNDALVEVEEYDGDDEPDLVLNPNNEYQTLSAHFKCAVCGLEHMAQWNGATREFVISKSLPEGEKGWM